jgi:hypothetical protein
MVLAVYQSGIFPVGYRPGSGKKTLGARGELLTTVQTESYYMGGGEQAPGHGDLRVVSGELVSP